MIPIECDWWREHMGRGTWGGPQSALCTRLLVLIAVIKETDVWVLRVTRSSLIYHSPSRVFLARRTGVISRWQDSAVRDFGGGDTQRSSHADGPGERSLRGLRIQTGAAAMSLACCTVLTFGRKKRRVILGWKNNLYPLFTLSSPARGIDPVNE